MTSDANKTREAARLDARDARLSLVFQVGREVIVRPLPESGVLEVGRDASCEVVLDSESVSRRHARLRVDAGVLEIEDLGSTNGTRILGSALRGGERRKLAPGDVIELGDEVVAFLRRGPVEEGHAAPPPKRPANERERPSVVKDPRMQELYRVLDVVAPSPFCVLVLGETGVGKDVFAEALHARSTRASGPFMRINCAALAESILESELFGHEKGAFTGAVGTKLGLFEAADGGTVFLDEVGELPLTTQAKLLRVLENGEVMRLGSVKTKRVDVRFVSATNRDLQAQVEKQVFRADLYFRLSGVVLTIPPLRERPQDIDALAEYFVADTGKRLGRGSVKISAAAKARLHAHEWPGNIRELRNVLERAVLLAQGGVLEATHLDAMAVAAGRAPETPQSRAIAAPAAPAAMSVPAAPAATSLPASGSFKEQVQVLERQQILDALEKCAGNQSRAAKMLGIPRRTFVKRLDAYGVVRPRKDSADED